MEPGIEKNAKDNGREPASGYSVPNDYWAQTNGLTKREYMATIALQGLLASYAGIDQNPQPKEAAERAIRFADALLLELQKTAQ